MVAAQPVAHEIVVAVELHGRIFAPVPPIKVGVLDQSRPGLGPAVDGDQLVFLGLWADRSRIKGEPEPLLVFRRLAR